MLLTLLVGFALLTFLLYAMLLTQKRLNLLGKIGIPLMILFLSASMFAVLEKEKGFPSHDEAVGYYIYHIEEKNEITVWLHNRLFVVPDTKKNRDELRAAGEKKGKGEVVLLGLKDGIITKGKAPPEPQELRRK